MLSAMLLWSSSLVASLVLLPQHVSRSRPVVASSSGALDGLSFRTGTALDSLPIAAKLLEMKMNPLGVDHTRFIVCESSQGERIGFGQIRQLAASKAPDATEWDARPGSGDIEADADDAAWEDLEEEGVPSGLDSLPWSPGYKKLQQRAAVQRARRAGRVASAEAEAQPLYELASIFVEDEWRGRGIGTAIIERLLDRHVSEGRGDLSDIYLLTLDSTCGWYENLPRAFVRVPKAQVPTSMAFEVSAGEALSFLLGNTLVCMRGVGGL